MRPPWIEATALLAAAGRDTTPLTFRRRPRMSDDIRYGLMRHPEKPGDKPVAKPDLAGWADLITRERQGRPILLEDNRLGFEDRPRDGVTVWLVSPDGDRCGCIGFAYLNGAGREALQAALTRAAPQRVAA